MLSILIIDNDLPTLELYQRTLSQDYLVFTCVSEVDAQRILQQQAVDAIVLEPAMHNGQGWAVLNARNEAAEAHRIPVIICSTVDERRRGLDMGAAACLVKPVLPATLRDVLQQILHSLFA
jgi:DNA-binding response OmpR family regulator